MVKKKRKKIIQLPQSLDTKIRTRARNLTIGKCYISENWEQMREGNIIVTRKHSNGNLTFAYFLVDLGLLGVKDSFYDFNYPEEDFLVQLEKQGRGDNFIEIDYNLAHNIIYGGVEYAEEYGFYPCKEYAISKYVLEEDDENIPLIDVEYGVDGLPTVFCNNENPMTREIKQLEDSIGQGNFEIINTDSTHGDDDFDDAYEDDEYYDDLYDELMQGWDDDIEDMGVLDWNDEQWIEFLKQDPKNYSFRVLQYFADMTFYQQNKNKDVDAFKHVLGGASYSDSNLEMPSPKEIAIFGSMEGALKSGDINHIAVVMENAEKEFEDNAAISLMVVVYKSDGLDAEEAEQMFRSLIHRFPGNIDILNTFAGWLMDNGQEEKIPELFNYSYSLKEFLPEKDFSTNEVISFCSAYCNYFMIIDDLLAAQPYYEVLNTIDDGNPQVMRIIQYVVIRKLHSLRDEIDRKRK